MQSQFLSPFERVFVEELRANTRDKVVYMKLSVMVMLDEGLTQQTISVLLGIGLGTVSNCKKKYESEGLEHYLDRHYVPYGGKLSDEQLALLEDEVRTNLYATCEQVGEWIKVNFNIEYSESAVRAILSKLGFVYKKTSLVPGGVNTEEQAAFLAEMEPFLAETEETEAVYFMDAVHPQHNTRADFAWIKRGEKQVVRSNSGRQRMNINGAMNAHQPEDVIIHVADTIDAQAVIALFEKILVQNPDKSQIHIFCDNARYNKCIVLNEYLEKNPKIQLIYLPTYSPNLNLIERLWKFMRKKVMNLKFYAKFKEFQAAILHFFDTIKQHKSELQTLMKPNFQRFSVSPMT